MFDNEAPSCRIEDELDNQPSAARTMGFYEAWMLAAARKSLKDGAVTMTPPNLYDIFTDVRDAYADIQDFSAANDGFSVGCDKTAAALGEHFAARKLDPAVIEGFHMVRGHYEDPTRHAPAKNVIAHIERSL
jgi:hypothetical protein